MTSKSAPQHPGRILFDQVMAPLGVSRNKLARDIDVPVGRISDIVNGKRGVTPDTALRLSRYFGTKPELWMRLQWEYDLYMARVTTWPNIEPRVRVFDPSEVVLPEQPVAVVPEDQEFSIDPEEVSMDSEGSVDTDAADSGISDRSGGGEIPSSAGNDSPDGVDDISLSENEPDLAGDIDVDDEMPGVDGDDYDTDNETSIDGDRVADVATGNTEKPADGPARSLGGESDAGDEVDSARPVGENEPLVLIDSIDSGTIDEEYPGAGIASVADDNEDESLEIPDPDKVRYRVTSD